MPHQSIQGNPPTLPKSSKLVLTHSPPDSPTTNNNPNFSPPPQVDRTKKPSGKSAAERLFGGDSYGNLGVDGRISQESYSSPLRNVINLIQAWHYDAVRKSGILIVR